MSVQNKKFCKYKKPLARASGGENLQPKQEKKMLEYVRPSGKNSLLKIEFTVD